MNIAPLKRWTILALLLSCFLSCYDQRKIMDAWVGKNIHDLILQAGPPAQVTSDGANGKIYFYAISSPSAYTGETFYNYAFWYTRPDGTIYHWLTRKGTIPPQRVNVDLYIH